MCNGELKCIGTSQYLKSKFGSDFQLDIKMVSPNAENILKIFEKQFQKVCILEDYGLFCRFGIQLKNQNLYELFEFIEAEKNDLLIRTYALSQPSLDQVFVQFAKEQTQPEDEIL